jgi:hypothetical protein
MKLIYGRQKVSSPIVRLAFFAALLLAAGRVFGLDGFFMGIEAEANGNTREGAAFGGGVSFGFDLNRHTAAGVKAMYGSDLDTITALQAAAFFRWYPLVPPRGFFAQLEAGATLFLRKAKLFRRSWAPLPWAGVLNCPAMFT